ncbi:MAG: ATP-binding protein [Polyangiaceae bacterium]
MSARRSSAQNGPDGLTPSPTRHFVGRSSELAALERLYAHREAALVPIYGRRRVGKSELILRFMEGKPAIYVVGKVAPAQLQRDELLLEAARALDEPLLAEMRPTDWKQTLLRIVERHRGPKKLVIALDEFQWMVEASPELPSVLQELWDLVLKKRSDVFLILCGSYVGFMEREVLGSKSPLFGRRTSQIKLLPFSFAEAAEFHARWSLVDRAIAYFLTGGVPMYLLALDSAASVEQSIVRALLNEHAPLFREPEFLLREELRDVASYHGVLMAVAEGGAGSFAEIGARASVPARSLPYYLDQLVALGYLGKRYPLTEAKPTARSVRYVVDDPLLRFWFRFVFPNLSFLHHAGPRATFTERVRPHLPSYFGSCFERLCREALPAIYAEEGVTASFEVGSYWDRSVEIDVVGLRHDRRTDLGECKWGTLRSLAAPVAELEAKVARYPNARNATIGRRIFVRARAGKAPPGVVVHDLEQLYAAAGAAAQ